MTTAGEGGEQNGSGFIQTLDTLHCGRCIVKNQNKVLNTFLFLFTPKACIYCACY